MNNNLPAALVGAMILNRCWGAEWVADRSWHPDQAARLFAEAMAGNPDAMAHLIYDTAGARP